MRSAYIRLLIVAGVALFAAPLHAGVIFGFSGGGQNLGGGYRWDAAPRNINISGTNYERSLNGSLRYSVFGGSMQTFRDQFVWDAVPTVGDFSTAVQQAFDAWTVVDPATGLTSSLAFVFDPSTSIVTAAGGGIDARGAEIDLFGSTDGSFWNPGNTGTQGETFFSAIGSQVTLTSGVANYAGSGAISGADIRINSNAGAVYSLALFRRLLTHEIGHAIGLGDVEGDINAGAFIDDNFDITSSATTLATLTNSWAGLVDPLNPAASPLSRYTVPWANPGTQTPGVDILMESRGLGIGASNPLGNLLPLTNDDFGTRQFLYPSLTAVPEPGTFALLAAGGGLLVWRRRTR